MTIRSQIAGTRLEDELKMFHDAGNNGITTYELADMTGVGYYTARNDVNSLLRYGKIAHSGRVRDKSIIFCAVGKSNVPTVLFNRQAIPFTAFIDQRLQGVTTRPIDMTKILGCALVGIAARAKAGPGEKVDFYPRTIKQLLVESVDRAQAFVDAANSILEDPRYWNENQLPDNFDVEKYDLDKLVALTRILLVDITGDDDDNVDS